MIKVNLLPQDVAGGARALSRSEGPGLSSGAVAALIMVLVYVGLSIVGFWVVNHKIQSDNLLKEAQRKQQGVKDEIAKLDKKYKALRNDRALFENQLEVLDTLDPKERLLWCEKFNLLPELVPEGIFITRIKVDEEAKEVETMESLRRQKEWEQGGRKGAKPPSVKKPFIKQTMTIEGVAYVEGGQSERRLELVSTFLRNLREKEAAIPYTKKSKSFMENFEGEPAWDPITADRIGNREVSKFLFKLKTRPF